MPDLSTTDWGDLFLRILPALLTAAVAITLFRIQRQRRGLTCALISQEPVVSISAGLEFERGRLVLEVQAGDPAALVDQMIVSAPAAMSVTARSPSAITFQLS